MEEDAAQEDVAGAMSLRAGSPRPQEAAPIQKLWNCGLVEEETKQDCAPDKHKNEHCKKDKRNSLHAANGVDVSSDGKCICNMHGLRCILPRLEGSQYCSRCNVGDNHQCLCACGPCDPHTSDDDSSASHSHAV